MTIHIEHSVKAGLHRLSGDVGMLANMIHDLKSRDPITPYDVDRINAIFDRHKTVFNSIVRDIGMPINLESEENKNE